MPVVPGREARRAAVRAAVAAALAGGAAALARGGGAPWSAALALAAGAAAFAAWRTVAGACAGFLAMLAAALAGLGSGGLGRLGAVVPALAGLELLGLASVGLVALVRQPRKVGRRLLGAWLASSGLVATGLALATREETRPLAGVLLSGGLAYRLGVVPAYAWAPLLLRHPARRVVGLGALALAAAAVTLALVMARLPEPAAARWSLRALAAATLPWAAWQAVRQRGRDPACARTYAVVAAMSVVLLAAA